MQSKRLQGHHESVRVSKATSMHVRPVLAWSSSCLTQLALLAALPVVQLGVAMGNAGPRVKAAADVVVCTNDEGGVAEAIERWATTGQVSAGQSLLC